MVERWYLTDLPKLREVTGLVMRVELLSPGRGARSFREEQVRVTFRR